MTNSKSTYRVLKGCPIRNLCHLSCVNYQIRPWIFTGWRNSSLNYAKYQLSPWICQTSIKKVHLSKCSVSHAYLSHCMLCCLVHMARRKSRVQGLIWLNWKKFSFHFSVFFFFCFSHFCPCITHTSFFTFQSETPKMSLALFLPAKTFSILTPPKSSSSPTILTFMKFLCSAVIENLKIWFFFWLVSKIDEHLTL